MSPDEKDTAASPDVEAEEVSKDERAEFNRLQKKIADVAEAKARQEAEEKKEEELDRQEEIKENQRYHVLIRHIGRSPKTRTLRAMRAGRRRQGVILQDGTRIRKRGKRRTTRVSLEVLVDNHEVLLENVRVGQLEVLDPQKEMIIPYPELLDLVMDMGQWVTEKRRHEAGVAHEAALEKHAEDMKAYKKQVAKWEEASKVAKKANRRMTTAKPKPPVKPEMGELAGDFKLSPRVKYPDEPVEKLPSTEIESEDLVEESDERTPVDPSKDPTISDPEAAAMTASVDQANAKRDGEANDPPSERSEVLTEEDLKKMGRKEIDDLAVNNKIDPGKYSKKEDLIEALLSLGEE